MNKPTIIWLTPEQQETKPKCFGKEYDKKWCKCIYSIECKTLSEFALKER